VTVIAQARALTGDATGYLEAVCRQLAARAEVRREPDGAAATVDLGWARYALTAGRASLAVRIEAADDAALRQAAELLRRHLEGHAPVALTWDREDAPIARTDAERRDAMRAFHARMRAG
jgi:YD repeat-containing protein